MGSFFFTKPGRSPKQFKLYTLLHDMHTQDVAKN